MLKINYTKSFTAQSVIICLAEIITVLVSNTYFFLQNIEDLLDCQWLVAYSFANNQDKLNFCIRQIFSYF